MTCQINISSLLLWKQEKSLSIEEIEQQFQNVDIYLGILTALEETVAMEHGCIKNIREKKR